MNPDDVYAAHLRDRLDQAPVVSGLGSDTVLHRSLRARTRRTLGGAGLAVAGCTAMAFAVGAVAAPLAGTQTDQAPAASTNGVSAEISSPPATQDVAPGVRATAEHVSYELANGVSVVDLGLGSWGGTDERFFATYTVADGMFDYFHQVELWSGTDADLAALLDAGQLDDATGMDRIPRTGQGFDYIVTDDESNQGLALHVGTDTDRWDAAGQSVNFTSWSALDVGDGWESWISVEMIGGDRAGAPALGALAWDGSGVVPAIRQVVGTDGDDDEVRGSASSCTATVCSTTWDGESSVASADEPPADFSAVREDLTGTLDEFVGVPLQPAMDTCLATRTAADHAAGVERSAEQLTTVCLDDMTDISSADIVTPTPLTLSTRAVASLAQDSETTSPAHRTIAPASGDLDYVLRGHCAVTDESSRGDYEVVVSQGDTVIARTELPCRTAAARMPVADLIGEQLSGGSPAKSPELAAGNADGTLEHQLDRGITGSLTLAIEDVPDDAVFDVRIEQDTVSND